MMFSEEVAWVTGSSTGIGAASAVALAEAGCRVAVHYNRSEDEAREVVERISSSGGEAMLVGGDVADAGEIERMAGEIEDRYGRLDILVNNAGSLIERRSFSEMTEDLWDRVMEVNLKSVFLCSQAVLPTMKRQGKGRIINVTSVAARNGGGPGSAAYAAAKGGVTPFHERFTPPEIRERMTAGIPIGREGTPGEVAGTVVFLASPAADYLVGEIIEVNGGQLMD